MYLFETIFAMEMCDNRLVVCSSGQKVVVVVRLYTYVLNMIPLWMEMSVGNWKLKVDEIWWRALHMYHFFFVVAISGISL